MNKRARIKSNTKQSPFYLTVVQTSRGVFLDKVDPVRHERQFLISVSPKSARKLAQWILDNVTTGTGTKVW